MLPISLAGQIQSILGAEILGLKPVAGGDINQALMLETSAKRFFLKVNTAPQASRMFEAEASGLALLAASKTIRTPEVLGFSDSPDGAFLLLEYIEPGFRPDGFWEKFGAALAELHRHSAASFGLDNNNFIGSLPQSNQPHDTWPDFYIHERLRPQLELATQRNHLHRTDLQNFDRLFYRLPELFPTEAPALVHGDLWSGNFLCDSNGQPVLIDPATSFSQREMDLAMSRLFGGFDRTFFRSYEQAWPLAPGFEQRLPVYQLYYLLVHVNLFGGGYVDSVRSILKQFI